MLAFPGVDRIIGCTDPGAVKQTSDWTLGLPPSRITLPSRLDPLPSFVPDPRAKRHASSVKSSESISLKVKLS